MSWTGQSQANGSGRGTVALQRFHNFLRGDGSIVILLLACLLAIAWAVEQSEWVDTPSLAWVAMLGIATGLVLARVRRPAWLLLPLGIAVGLMTSIWQASSVSGLGGFDALRETAVRTFVWTRAAIGGGISADWLPFAFLLVAITWLTAFFSAWSVFRLRNPWVVLILAGSGLMINLAIDPSPRTARFFWFLLPVLLLMARMRCLDSASNWARRHFSRLGRVGWSGMRDGTVFVSVILVIAFLVPIGKPWQKLDRPYQVIHRPVARINSDFQRLFAGLAARVPGSYRSFGEQMALGGANNLEDSPAMIVESPVPVYLAARFYDTYTSKGWKVRGPSQMHEPEWRPADSVIENYTGGQTAVISVRPLFPTESIFTAGLIQSIDRSIEFEAYSSLSYNINLRDSSQNIALPESIKDVTKALQTALSRSRTPQSQLDKEALQQLLPQDLIVVDVTYSRNLISTIRVERMLPDPVDVISTRTLDGPSSDTYELTTALSSATTSDLRIAGTVYPGWVTDLYLQLPNTLPQRVRDLAQTIVKGAKTPYDKAAAIQAYLRDNFEYSLQIEAPPYDTDATDYFLFTQKKGYCDYYASAMTVLLRAAGVPSRMAAGYAPGEQASDNSFLVRDRDAHSWPQVYFPGNGWINFEPTPSRPTILDGSFTVEPDPMFPSGLGGSGAGPLEPEEDEDMSGIIYPGGPLNSGLGWPVKLLWLLIPMSLAVILLVVWRKAVNPVPTPEAAYYRMCLYGRLGGFPVRESDTPFQYAVAFQERWPEAQRQVRAISESYVKQRYGKRVATPEETASMNRGWTTMRSLLVKRFIGRRKTG